MYFQIKNILKNNNYHTSNHPLRHVTMLLGHMKNVINKPF
jgi:hypothetical protein